MRALKLKKEQYLSETRHISAIDILDVWSLMASEFWYNKLYQQKSDQALWIND